MMSAESGRLFAYLSYRDAHAAIDWLTAAFGFTVVTKQLSEDASEVIHCEMRRGDAVIMLAGYDRDYQPPPAVVGSSTGGGLYIYVDDVGAVWDSAVASGATVLYAPEQTEWGTSRFRVLDPEGHEWTFGTYLPGEGW